jgi:cell division septal protein FtsQ
MSEALRKENILSMSVMRDILRDAYLKPYFHPQQFAVKTQWSVFPLFLVLFIGGVVLWFVMLKRYGLFTTTKATDQ